MKQLTCYYTAYTRCEIKVSSGREVKLARRGVGAPERTQGALRGPWALESNPFGVKT
jgi:hypothetical protein